MIRTSNTEEHFSSCTTSSILPCLPPTTLPSLDKGGTSPAVCAGCHCPITDQYILRVPPNLEWHASCLKCDECSKYLDETCTCFIREGKPYCKKDFVRRYGAKCHRCNQGFSSNDFVMRVRENIFHLSCFRCNMCSRQLLPGEEFALLPEGLICAVHIKQTPPADSTGCVSVCTNNPPNNTQVSSTSNNEPKTTRVRTVLNDRQLRILRTCYNNNPRPDALMKEQMTKLTGLSARVIRVWFQNKRCKDKKKAIAAANSDDAISSSVADSPSDDKLRDRGGNILENMIEHQKYSPLGCSQMEFNSSSASTSPSLSASGDTYSMFEQSTDRQLWTSPDFIPSYSITPNQEYTTEHADSSEI